MKLLDSIADIRSYVAGLRKTGKKIAFVPTMGALHEGHLSLVKKAQSKADHIIASIFVNPKQFDEGEDYDRYPNRMQSDKEKLTALGADALYLPSAKEIYPKPFLTELHVRQVTEGLCSNTRPHFFNGVAIVVTKLLMQVLPDIAVFGEKDYQQLLMVKQLVQDLNIPTEIISGEIIREADGLAMSSRNAYLSPEERAIAPHLFRIMNQTKQQLQNGQADVASAVQQAQAELLQAGFQSVDYYEVRNGVTLEPIQSYQKGKSARLIAAVCLESCRLIDNISLD